MVWAADALSTRTTHLGHVEDHVVVVRVRQAQFSGTHSVPKEPAQWTLPRNSQTLNVIHSVPTLLESPGSPSSSSRASDPCRLSSAVCHSPSRADLELVSQPCSSSPDCSCSCSPSVSSPCRNESSAPAA